MRILVGFSGVLLALLLVALAVGVFAMLVSDFIEEKRPLFWGLFVLLAMGAVVSVVYLFSGAANYLRNNNIQKEATASNAGETGKMNITLNYRKDRSNPYYMPLTSWVTTGYCVMDAGMANGENLGFEYKYTGSPTLNRIASPYNMIRHGLGYIVMNDIGNNLNNDNPVLALVCGNTDKDILGYVFLKSKMAKYCPPNSTARDMAEYLDSNLIFEPNTVVSKDMYSLYEYVLESMHFTLSKPFDTDKETQLIEDYDYENRIINIKDVE